jgi:hypothetical protein
MMKPKLRSDKPADRYVAGRETHIGGRSAPPGRNEHGVVGHGGFATHTRAQSSSTRSISREQGRRRGVTTGDRRRAAAAPWNDRPPTEVGDGRRVLRCLPTPLVTGGSGLDSWSCVLASFSSARPGTRALRADGGTGGG